MAVRITRRSVGRSVGRTPSIADFHLAAVAALPEPLRNFPGLAPHDAHCVRRAKAIAFQRVLCDPSVSASQTENWSGVLKGEQLARKMCSLLFEEKGRQLLAGRLALFCFIAGVSSTPSHGRVKQNSPYPICRPLPCTPPNSRPSSQRICKPTSETQSFLASEQTASGMDRHPNLEAAGRGKHRRQ